jgi:hypothetical protein
VPALNPTGAGLGLLMSCADNEQDCAGIQLIHQLPVQKLFFHKSGQCPEFAEEAKIMHLELKYCSL